MGFGDGGFDEAEPVLIGFLAAFVGDDFDDLTVFYMVIERSDFPVDFGAGHAVADLAVYGVGEIDRRCFLGEFDDVAFGRKGKDMVFEKIYFNTFEKFAIVLTDFFLPFLELFDPGEFFGGRRFVTAKEEFAPAGAALLFRICPVSGDAELRFIVHFLGADLNFNNASLGTEDGSMD